MKDERFLVQILGKPQVLKDGHLLNVERRKARALLYYVAAHSYPVSREELLNILWPEQQSSAAQHTLSVILYDLRKFLDGLLVVDKNLLSFAPTVEVDARVFKGNLTSPLCNPGLIHEALQLYRGDFLEGFNLPNAPEYNLWLEAERERYVRMRIRGLALVAEHYEKQGELYLALESLERALDLEPLQEDLQCSCMRLLYLVGDRPGAIRQYQKLCRLLDEEMGVPPMPQTMEVYEAVITDTLRESMINRTVNLQANNKRMEKGLRSKPPDPMPFAGRKAELQKMHELVQDNKTGVIFIEGEPGIGKTRLTEEFIRNSEALILRGTARELEQILPYQPFVEALRELRFRPEWPTLDELIQSELAPIWREEIECLIPEMKNNFSIEKKRDLALDKHRLWEAIKQLLSVLAVQRRVIFILDDLQWADTSTLGLLSYLVRQAGDEPIMFVGITRPFNRKSRLAKLIQALGREVKFVRIALQPLELDDLAFIAQHFSLSQTKVLADYLMNISEGSPYIVKEVVQYMLETGYLSPDGQVNLNALSKTTVIPKTVHNFISMRLGRLTVISRSVLDTAAVVGREFDFMLVAKAVALSEDAALDGLEDLCSLGIIRTVGGFRYTFDHSLTQEVVYREIETSRSKWLHRRIAEALESAKSGHQGSSAGLIAWHFSKSNVPERATPYALLAGKISSHLGAWNEAIAFYEQALTYLDDLVRISVMHNLGIMLIADRQGHRAAQIYRKAAALAISQGKTAYAELCLGCALIVENPDFSEVIWGMPPVLLGEDVPEAKKHLKKAELLMEEAGLVELLPNLKLSLGLIEARQGNLHQAVAYLREGFAIAAGAENVEAMLHIKLVTQMNLSALLQIIDDPSAYETALAGLKQAQEKDMRFIQPQLLSILGKIALADHDLHMAENYFSQGLVLAERMSMLYVVADITDCLGQLALKHGQKELAVSLFSKALVNADTLEMNHQATQIRMRLASLLPPAEAEMRLMEIRELIKKGGYLCLFERINLPEAEKAIISVIG
ncbi:AAA family ATPase [Desulfitobacterium hafniense]|uniref:Bacterial transcriptional activator domain-containing protein n=1 Tax=Desulfitobacterium hafniense (strain Y51) TaxID=138119 RepID=Q24QU7_DESHY|nr:AAA family ATPase [Desulfitobacterium hafniense]BAE85595.1 hypothetical protein DSY3806 [Desulfitobacterium hafniense Y51]